LFSRAVDATTKLPTVRIRNSHTNKVSPLRRSTHYRFGTRWFDPERGRLLSLSYPTKLSLLLFLADVEEPTPGSILQS
jgi:hypothetical protein